MFPYGAAITAVIAGPFLWPLVRSGRLDGFTALERGALLALACSAGLEGLNRLLLEYERQAGRARLTKALEEHQAALDAAAAAAAAAAASASGTTPGGPGAPGMPPTGTNPGFVPSPIPGSAQAPGSVPGSARGPGSTPSPGSR